MFKKIGKFLKKLFKDTKSTAQTEKRVSIDELQKESRKNNVKKS